MTPVSSVQTTESYEVPLIAINRQTSLVGWLVVLGLTGPLIKYFSLYLKEKEERNDRREKKYPNNPHPHLLQEQ